MTETSYVAEPDHPPRVAHFGSFELDLRTAELRRNGTRVRLQEQPFRLLAMLLERPGDVVTREEIRQRLWPSEFVDFDHSLNAAVRKLREALGDSAENPRFIETLARRGYRFIAPVSWDAETPAPRRRPTWIILPVVLIIGIVGYFLLRPPPKPQLSPINAIAVLPFTNDDPQTQHLSDGLTEILIDRLSRLPDLRVMARTTVFALNGTKLEAREAGKKLNVGGIITGHIRRDGDRYQIHVELIDVKDGTQLWGYQFDATPATLSAVQSQISDELTNELREGVSREQRQIVASRYTRDPQAYDDYLWGLYAWNKRRDRENVQNAIKYFNQAIARDPNFAAAYAGLANTYGVMVGYGGIQVSEGTAKVLSLARKALDLDPYNAEALVSIATTKYRNLWDFAGADADYRRGLSLNPNYATGHEWYADYLRSMGRWDEARHEISVAHQLDPLSWPINTMVCFNLYYERRYREAIEVARRAATIDPNLVAPSCVAQSFIALGQIEPALQMLTAAHVPAEDKAQISDAYRRGGARAFFRKSAELLAQRQSENVETPVEIASLYAQAGDSDQAFAWLETAYRKRVSRLTNVNVEPAFDSLHSDPRYDDLLRRIGLPKVTPPRAN